MLYNIEMRYLLSALVILLVRAEIELSHFNAPSTASAVHQLNTNTILVGTSSGSIQHYTIKGQLIREQIEPHRSCITSLQSFYYNGSSFIISADRQGLIAVWLEDQQIQKTINTNNAIFQIVANEVDASPLLAVNLGHSVHFYQLTGFTLTKTIKKQGKIFEKILRKENNSLYTLLRDQYKSEFYIYDYNSDEFEFLLVKEYGILDYSVGLDSADESYHLMLINHHKHLQIYHLSSNHSIIGYLSKQESNFMPASYSLLTFFPNYDYLPIFAVLKANHQLEFFYNFDITLFLQLNSEIKAMTSTLSNQLVLLSANGQITTIVMSDTEDEESIGLWILLLIVVLLIAALYICCGDFWPGVVENWRKQKEQKEIELELYRQRTELDNF